MAAERKSTVDSFESITQQIYNWINENKWTMKPFPTNRIKKILCQRFTSLLLARRHTIREQSTVHKEQTWTTIFFLLYSSPYNAHTIMKNIICCCFCYLFVEAVIPFQWIALFPKLAKKCVLLPRPASQVHGGAIAVRQRYTFAFNATAMQSSSSSQRDSFFVLSHCAVTLVGHGGLRNNSTRSTVHNSSIEQFALHPCLGRLGRVLLR